jgi:hypothetical protein
MMKARGFVLSFDLDNASFDADGRNDAIGDILDHVATMFHDGHVNPFGEDDGPVYDINGNAVGSWSVKRVK